MSPLTPAWIAAHAGLVVVALVALLSVLAIGAYRLGLYAAHSLTRYLRTRAAKQVLSARELRRQRLGGHLSDSMERVVETRVTETHEPPRRWYSIGSRHDAKRSLETPRFGVCDGQCVGEGGEVKPLKTTRRDTYCGTCSRPAWEAKCGACGERRGISTNPSLCSRCADWAGLTARLDAEMAADRSSVSKVGERLREELQETPPRPTAAEVWGDLIPTATWTVSAGLAGGVVESEAGHLGAQFPGVVTDWVCGSDSPSSVAVSNGTDSLTLTGASDGARVAMHPLGWTCVNVSTSAGNWLCAVPRSGPMVHFHDEHPEGWHPAPEWLAKAAREALGRST